MCFPQCQFSILINDSTSAFFRPGRGLRQGCPLSPLLFLVVAEGLSRALMYAKRSGSFRGIKIGGSLYLSHLLFVDDLILFCDGSRSNTEKLKDILDLYSIATGMKINVGESTVSFSGVDEDNVTFLSQLFAFQQINFQSALKYLGFYLKPNDYCKRDWDRLVAKVEKRLTMV